MENQEKMELLETAREYVPNLIGGIISSYEYFRQDNPTKALELLTLVVDGLSWSITAISNLLLELSFEEVNEQLKELIESMENQDYVYLADLLEYEILPVVENWEELLGNIDLSSTEQA